MYTEGQTIRHNHFGYEANAKIVSTVDDMCVVCDSEFDDEYGTFAIYDEEILGVVTNDEVYDNVGI